MGDETNSFDAGVVVLADRPWGLFRTTVTLFIGLSDMALFVCGVDASEAVSSGWRPGKTVAWPLRGAIADQFMADVEDDNPQEHMARVTGNYELGVERTARNHRRSLRR